MERINGIKIDGENKATYRDSIKNAFKEFNGDPNNGWGFAADMFLAWNVKEGFQTKSFAAFCEYMEDDYEAVFGDKVWGFFFGYADEFESFAEDWVDDTEKAGYLDFCKKHI